MHVKDDYGQVLAGKVALVIGGGGDGIGRAITRALAAVGASVAVADHDPSRADEAAAEIATSGARACALTGDVRSAEAVNDFVKRTAGTFGALDVLVTVVGGQVAFVPAVRVQYMSDDDWDLAFDLNLRYVMRAVRAAVAVFQDQGRGGVIVSVGSVTGSMGAPMQGAYGAAKAGLASLARTIGAEYSRDGIRMNVIGCGAIATPVAGGAQPPDEASEVPMGRYGQPDEVADAAVFLASSLSSYMTGQCLVLDGGLSARGPFR
jgi:3-oxoacyl-[acyl-carrier protein] reductase